MLPNINKLHWYFSRLKAMNLHEIFWRLNQILINSYETFLYCSNPSNICSIKYGKGHTLNINKLNITINNDFLKTDYSPKPFAGFSYASYKDKWSYGFNTNNTWPSVPSYKLNYKGRDDIGDARINWELNRHHQFTVLAKNYCITKEKKFIDELENLFCSWNKENPFLFGLSWTNNLEIAIRCINWIFTYRFIYEIDKENSLLKDLEAGIINMSNYVYKHLSKYSSANNHTIVELSCILITSILTNNNKLTNKIIKLLTKEINKQFYSDGVNKEQSLHYEAFSLEAISLATKILKDNNYDVDYLKPLITNACKYVSDCLDEYNQVIEFGDNDEGYIIRFGDEENYYKYVVNLAYSVFKIPYSLQYTSETLGILIGQKNFEQKYHHNFVSSYKDGGITLIKEKNIFIGIDHGPLGLGSIAAHGHADALSFQIFIDNKKLLIDPGTFVYHVNESKRNYYRSTINHNTVCINNKNQSEIKGPFLWGKKANTKLISLNNNKDQIKLLAKHDGYGTDVYREFEFSNMKLKINDQIKNKNGVANFSFGPECSLTLKDNTVKVYLNNKSYSIDFKGNITNIEKKTKSYSPQYGIEYNIEAIEVTFKDLLTTSINLRD